MKTTKVGHKVSPTDYDRIECQADGCEHHAEYCEYIGGGFYYYCEAHTRPGVVETLEWEAVNS
jgi:hypothetical protein